MKESLKEISQQKAEKFLNTFYFQYGHRSIADLAHVALAIERLSILAAICGRRRTTLGWPGTLDPLSGFQKGRLLYARFCEDQQARDLFAKRLKPIRGVRIALRPHLPLPGRHHA